MPIYSYGGCLYGADSRGMLWSINGNKITPINNTAHILYDDTDQFVNEFSTRKTIKVMGQERFLERCQEKRRHQLFTFHKEKRLEAVERQRHNDNIDTTLTCK